MASLKADGKMIFLMFFVAIIASVLISPIADQIFAETNTITVTNDTVTAPAVNATLDLTGRELLTATSVVNSTGQVIPGAILQTGLGSAGLLSVQLTLNDTAASSAGESVNVTYTANPDGYVDGATASLTSLVLLFAALAALISVIVILFRGESFKNLMSRG